MDTIEKYCNATKTTMYTDDYGYRRKCILTCHEESALECIIHCQEFYRCYGLQYDIVMVDLVAPPIDHHPPTCSLVLTSCIGLLTAAILLLLVWITLFCRNTWGGSCTCNWKPNFRGAIFVQAPEPATATEEEHEMMVLDHGMPADRSLVNSSHGIGLITRNPVEQPSTSSDTRQYGTAPRQVAPDNTGRTEVNGISESSEHETLPPSHSIEQVSGDLQSIPGGTHDVPDIARRTHAAAGRIDNVPEISHDPQPESWMGTTESGMLLCSPSDELDEYNPEHLPVIDSDRSLGADGQSGVYVILDDGLPSSPASGLITTASEAERSGSIISDVRT